MKKISITILFLYFMILTLDAQNLQVHYDSGSLLYEEQSQRPQVKTTLEMFRPDAGGSTKEYQHQCLLQIYPKTL